ncbi:MAG: hypothetical protein JW991_02510 [Candidatus Pacebacteria bacterium]|nr:hypothetical protein [Candidatus Paceibacterota bacterium]
MVHFEEAWNPTSQDNLGRAVLAGLIGYWRRFHGDKTEPPILQDSFFPSKATCQGLFREIAEAFPEAKYISHKIQTKFPADRLLVEINPGINLSDKEILDMTEERGIGLVFDPSHLLASERMVSRPGLPTRQPKGEWERQFQVFSSRLEVVDINPGDQKGDVGDLLAGRGMLKELASAAADAG